MQNHELILDKPHLQKMYTDFLTNEGYKHELEENGDIAFRYRDCWYSIEIYDEDPVFGRLCRMIRAEFDDNTKIQAHIAASKINGSSKLVRAYVRDEFKDKDFIVFVIGYLLTNPDDFAMHFKRMLHEMQAAYNEFNKIMNPQGKCH